MHDASPAPPYAAPPLALAMAAGGITPVAVLPHEHGAEKSIATQRHNAVSVAMRDLAEQLKIVRAGNREIDTCIDDMLHDAAGVGGTLRQHFAAPGRSYWSGDLTQALTLVPQDYNFSLGERDSISWAWVQPNDDWQPGEFQARHDHPGGSGLVVAHNAILALTAATLLVHASILEARTVAAIQPA